MLENNYYKKFIGQKLEVLIEEDTEDSSSGYTSNYIKVIVNKKNLRNTLYLTTITEVNGTDVYGE